MLNNEFPAGAEAQQSGEADGTTSSQTIGNTHVVCRLFLRRNRINEIKNFVMEITKEMIEKVQKMIVSTELEPDEHLGKPIIEITGSIQQGIFEPRLLLDDKKEE